MSYRWDDAQDSLKNCPKLGELRTVSAGRIVRRDLFIREGRHL